MEKRYAMKTCSSEREKLAILEEAINNSDLSLLLQAFAENVDLNAVLPSSVSTQFLQRKHVLLNCRNNYKYNIIIQKRLEVLDKSS